MEKLNRREDEDWEKRRVKTHHRWTFQSKDISRIGTCERLEGSRDEPKEKNKCSDQDSGDECLLSIPLRHICPSSSRHHLEIAEGYEQRETKSGETNTGDVMMWRHEITEMSVLTPWQHGLTSIFFRIEIYFRGHFFDRSTKEFLNEAEEDDLFSRTRFSYFACFTCHNTKVNCCCLCLKNQKRQFLVQISRSINWFQVDFWVERNAFSKSGEVKFIERRSLIRTFD